MGLLKGSASFVRFSVQGELPENPLDYIAISNCDIMAYTQSPTLQCII
jgi:hypothetical protein